MCQKNPAEPRLGHPGGGPGCAGHAKGGTERAPAPSVRASPRGKFRLCWMFRGANGQNTTLFFTPGMKGGEEGGGPIAVWNKRGGGRCRRAPFVRRSGLFHHRLQGGIQKSGVLPRPHVFHVGQKKKKGAILPHPGARGPELKIFLLRHGGWGGGGGGPFTKSIDPQGQKNPRVVTKINFPHKLSGRGVGATHRGMRRGEEGPAGLGAVSFCRWDNSPREGAFCAVPKFRQGGGGPRGPGFFFPGRAGGGRCAGLFVS